MEFDLTSRHAKWTHEQKRRHEQAKRKVEMEKRKRAAASKAQAEVELMQRQKRVDRMAELERLEQEAVEAQRVTGGISYRQQLRPVPTMGDGDQITLPVSALEQLNPQNALDLGVLTFELSLHDSSREETSGRERQTHAGVLEFTAEEGTVGLPPKVAASLFQSTPHVPRTIQVRFVRLEKGKFARLQPRGTGFGERDIDFKHLLEQSLKTHTTLTEGDVLFLRQGGETFEVVVAELQPEQAVKILNTDLEVDLMPCEAVARKKASEKRVEEEAARAVAFMQEKEALKASKMANVASEPAEVEKWQVKLVLRMAEGQYTRRFLHASLLQSVFEYVEALTGDDARQFQLVATYPRRVFGVDAANKSLQELGLTSRQEALFVERLKEKETNDNVAKEDENQETLVGRDPLPDAWREARQALEKVLDERMHSSAEPAIHAMEPIMPVAQSADREMKWQAQLIELEAMGFSNRLLNIDVLERYQGRLLRVVNFLSEVGTPVEDRSGTTVEH